MATPSQPDPTLDLPPSDASPERASAVPAEAQGSPTAGPSRVPAAVSVLHALAGSIPAVPHGHLREPDNEPATPVVRPRSSAMPETPDVRGRYQLVGEIARGGMGAILKGRDVDLGRDIALKVLLETHAGRTELLQRF